MECLADDMDQRQAAQSRRLAVSFFSQGVSGIASLFPKCLPPVSTGTSFPFARQARDQSCGRWEFHPSRQERQTLAWTGDCLSCLEPSPRKLTPLPVQARSALISLQTLQCNSGRLLIPTKHWVPVCSDCIPREALTLLPSSLSEDCVQPCDANVDCFLHKTAVA